jgi:hypothetical protein
MTQVSLRRKLALAAALVSALSLAGAALAASSPQSTHASPTAVTHVAANRSDTNSATGNGANANGQGTTVSAAAQSAFTGGAHNNHGGYVSCIARGGSNCTTTTPTLPTHGAAASHSKASVHRH